MDADEFRRHGHRIIDWIADYLEHADRYPVLSPLAPGRIRDALPKAAPEVGESMDDIVADFEATLLPGVTHWNHPRFFAYFPANHSGPSILAELLSAGLGVNGMVWQSCPAATELEEVVMEWLRQAIDLPADFRGVIQDTASTATLCALLCARERHTGFDANRQGGQAMRGLRVYTSTEAHSSVEKGAKIAGFGAENVVRIPVDGDLALNPDALEAQIAADREAGLQPCCISATLGTTSSTAIDPLPAIGAIAQRHGLWLHVDAALAGSAAILPEMRHFFVGLELADSYVFNPHKWLFTNFDCSAYFTRHPDLLTRTFSILPEYLKTGLESRVTNYRDWGIPLGRRFRSLKLWFVLRHYGLAGLRQRLRDHLILAQEFAAWVDAAPDFERLAPVPLQTVCFRYNPHRDQAEAADDAHLDRLNQALMQSVNASGKIFITHTKIRGQTCLRMSIGQIATRRRHVEEAWQTILAHRPQ